jgi:hypothetical protein
LNIKWATVGTLNRKEKKLMKMKNVKVWACEGGRKTGKKEREKERWR